MSFDSRFLTLKEAARYLGRSPRWMYRNWPALAQAGVRCYRVPKGAIRGNLMVDKTTLEAYLGACRIEPGSREFGAL